MSDQFQEQLQALRARSLHRKLREIGSAQGPEIQIVGRQLVNFSSNDYLGLAADPLLQRAAIEAIEKFGVGSGASRLVSGTQSPHVALEAALARWKRAPGGARLQQRLRCRGWHHSGAGLESRTSSFSTNSATLRSSMPHA